MYSPLWLPDQSANETSNLAVRGATHEYCLRHFLAQPRGKAGINDHSSELVWADEGHGLVALGLRERTCVPHEKHAVVGPGV
jgi:hypothetical protein